MSKIRITKDPEERKKEILDAAIRVFRKKDMKKLRLQILLNLLILPKDYVIDILHLKKSCLMQR